MTTSESEPPHPHQRYLGAHMPTTGGLSKAIERIDALQGTALQLFTKNQRQWQPPPLTQESIAAFRAAHLAWGDYPIASHDSYLINLAGTDPLNLERSIALFSEEIQRAAALGIALVVTHPGAHLGMGEKQGLLQYARNLDLVIRRADCPNVRILLETTAGQGTVLGYCFEHLARIIDQSAFPERLGVCFDTCHVFAAGYDLRTPENYARTLEAFERLIGLDRLHLFHLNDSKNGCGSRKDRHEHIGKGVLGLTPFACILNDTRLSHIPMVIETPKLPKDKDFTLDKENLRTLRSLECNAENSRQAPDQEAGPTS